MAAAAPQGSMFSKWFVINKKNNMNQAQAISAYMGGSLVQTVADNPVTAYRQFVQQYAKDAAGKSVDPAVSRAEANSVFFKAPLRSSLSGLTPRLVGVFFKRIPKFGALHAITLISSNDGRPGPIAATGASIASAPFINPIRMIEKQQRTTLKKTGMEKPIMEIIRESRSENFKPLFRGTVPLMGHSLASALLGLVGQPELKRYIQKQLGQSGFGNTAANLAASAIVSPIYVAVTNPLSRLEVIMQTAEIKGGQVSVTAAVKELYVDMAEFGMRGAFRGNGIGIAKAVLSLTLFHEGREMFERWFQAYNTGA